MKKILIILGVIFFIFTVGAVVFVLTFDINRYKDTIIEGISGAIEKDVMLERIALDLRHGLGCRVEGLALKEKDTDWDSAWLKARSVEVNVKILPLFKKDIQVNRIEIQGLDLKLSDKLLHSGARHRTYNVRPAAWHQTTDTGGHAALGALKFLAKVIVIRDSVVSYTAPDSIDAVKIGISSLILNNVSLSGPVRVSAVLSTLDKGKDNIVIKGIVFPELSSEEPYIKNLDLKLDTGGIDFPLLLRTFGYTQAAEQLVGKEIHGIVTVRAQKLFLYPEKIFDSGVSLKVSGFEIDALPFKGGVKNFMLDAEFSGNNLIIKDCSGSVAGGNIQASLIIRDIAMLINEKSAPCLEAVKARLELDGVDVHGIASALNNPDIEKFLSGDPVLKGAVSVKADRLCLDPEKILDSSIDISLEKFSTNIVAAPEGIKDVTLDAGFSGGDIRIKRLSAAVDGGTIIADGIIRDVTDFGKDKKLPALEDFTCRLNLDDLDAAWFFESFGKDELAKAMQGKRLDGDIVIKGDRLFLTPSDIFNSDASTSVSQLTTDIVGGKGGLSGVDIEVQLDRGDVVIKKISGKVAGGMISASGTIKNVAAVISGEGVLETENVFTQFNLQDFNIPELIAMFGKEDIAGMLEGKAIAGKVTLKTERFSLGQKERLSGLSILLSQGMTDVVPIQGGLKDIELEAVFEHDNLVVDKLTGSAAGGTFSIQGSIKDIFSSQLSDFDIVCSGINLDRLAPQTSPGAPRFQGVADLKANAAGEGLTQDKLIQSLSGTGSLKINEPVLKNMNILRAAFEKMDMIPGLVARLRQNLPENYTEVLRQNDTNFKPMDIAYTVSEGKLFFEDASLESDGFIVKAQGEIGLSGDIRADSHLFIASDLSQGFVDVVKELRFLANEEGMINMPLAITGKIGDVSVDIDRDYVLRKLIVSKGTELLEDIFRKKDESQGSPQPQQGSSQQDTERSEIQQKEESPPDPATLIKSIFDIIGSQDK